MDNQFLNPELMVIGDSLAQGCRSMTVSASLCSQSYATQASSAMGWTYSPPKHPYPVIFDLEEIIRNYVTIAFPVDIAPLLIHLENNLNAWRKFFQEPEKSYPVCYDNLAVAGATLADMTGLTYGSSISSLKSLDSFTFLELWKIRGQDLGTLYKAINSAFVLNPSGDPAYQDYNMLRWVEARKPKRLIVHMGHNDGLYAIGSGARPTDLTHMIQPYKGLIDQIAAITDRSQELIFILLPKVSAVANLAVTGSGPNNNGYWAQYQPVFSTSKNTFTAQAMQAQDDNIRSVNSAISAYLATLSNARPGSIHVISGYELFAGFDYKNSLDVNKQIKSNSLTIDNRYIEGSQPLLPPPFEKPSFIQGGFQSIDGMHPTMVGYAEVAAAIVRLYQPGFDSTKLVRDAVLSDTLIASPPAGLRAVLDCMHLSRHLPALANTAPAMPAHSNVFTDVGHFFDLLKSAIVKDDESAEPQL